MELPIEPTLAPVSAMQSLARTWIEHVVAGHRGDAQAAQAEFAGDFATTAAAACGLAAHVRDDPDPRKRRKDRPHAPAADRSRGPGSARRASWASAMVRSARHFEHEVIQRPVARQTTATRSGARKAGARAKSRTCFTLPSPRFPLDRPAKDAAAKRDGGQ